MDIGQTQSHGITKCRTESDRVVVETETVLTEREEERWQRQSAGRDRDISGGERERVVAETEWW